MFNTIKKHLDNKKAKKETLRRLDRRIADLERRIDNFGISFELTEDAEKAFEIHMRLIKMGEELRDLIIERDDVLVYGIRETGLVVA